MDATLTLNQTIQCHWDAVVIGAGPAGSLAALQLSRQGLRVLLVDKQSFPRYKVCGACLSPDAEAALIAAGMDHVLADLGAIPARQFRMGISGRMLTLPLRDGRIVSRDRLDDALAEAAVSCGCQFLSETTATIGPVEGEARLVRLSRRGESATVQARVVLIACGLAESRLEDGRHASVRPDSHIGLGCNLPDAPASYEAGAIYMAVCREGYVGQVLLEDGRLNVAAAVQPRLAQRDIGPAILEIIKRAGLPAARELATASWKGTPLLTRNPAALCAERVLRLGDAAGYVEPFTGEGIGWAMKSALAAVPIVLQAQRQWNAELQADWQVEYRKAVRSRQWTCKLLARALRRPRLVSGCARVLNAVPSLALPMMYLLNRPT